MEIFSSSLHPLPCSLYDLHTSASFSSGSMGCTCLKYCRMNSSSALRCGTMKHPWLTRNDRSCERMPCSSGLRRKLYVGWHVDRTAVEAPRGPGKGGGGGGPPGTRSGSGRSSAEARVMGVSIEPVVVSCCEGGGPGMFWGSRETGGARAGLVGAAGSWCTGFALDLGVEAASLYAAGLCGLRSAAGWSVSRVSRVSGLLFPEAGPTYKTPVRVHCFSWYLQLAQASLGPATMHRTLRPLQKLHALAARFFTLLDSILVCSPVVLCSSNKTKKLV